MRTNGIAYGKLKTPLKVNGNLEQHSLSSIEFFAEQNASL